jgi:isoleucyl-tRNA synthetase
MIKYVRQEMDNYRLYNVVRHMLTFLENLTNWYVRLNRPRMKGDFSAEDQKTALNVLFDVLMSATQLMAPICPFISEYLFQNLRNGLAENDPLNVQSIHFTDIPSYDDALIDEDIMATVERMQSAIEVGRLIRSREVISMKYPLAKVRLVDAD